MSLSKKMGDEHEAFIADLYEGHQTRGSGNQWANPIDGRQSRKHRRFAFGWDCKSTLAKSIGVSLAMWDKAREQAGGERPMVPLRFYADEKLRVTRDLVVMDAHDVAELLEAAENPKPVWKFDTIREDGEVCAFYLNGVKCPGGWRIQVMADLGMEPEILINGALTPYDTEIWENGTIRYRGKGWLT